MILDIVVDVQKDFITGALANPQAQANVTRLAETVKAHARAGHWLFLTRDTHPDNYLATREGRHLPVEHCIEGEDGWNFAPELENALDGTAPEVCHIVNKPTFGSYMLPSEILDELMAHNKAVDDIEKIVIYGYCTDICVISNAMVMRAAFPETEIEILSDCCAGVTPQSHQTALDAMRACQFTIVRQLLSQKRR
ncbi:MAG: cysteine hydrolase [Subdoligranulum variabile]|nr:cysteine hydrolase [Subdoligranulum variabile]